MNPIWGYFDYQSFDINTIKNLCLNWVNGIGCDPLSPMCPLYTDYILTGGVAPASPTDVVRIRGRCASGTTMDKTYAGVLSVRCSRDY